MKYLIVFFLLLNSVLHAQTDSVTIAPEETMESMQADLVPVEEREPYTPPPAKPVAMREVENQQWDKATAGLDYSKDVPAPPKEPETPVNTPQMPSFNWGGLASWLGQILQVLAIIAAIAGIAYGIYRALNAPRNRQISRDGVEITIDNVEQYIHESDLDRFLREALAAGNYALAIRLYYLQTIKQLSETGAIRWSREKTNRDYLRETRTHRSAEAFRAATRIYERVWYGNQRIGEPDYRQLEPTFKNLLSSL
jgi:hypothetical protein